MSMTRQSTQQKLPFSYEVVFNAIITVLPSIRFRLKSKNKDIGRITANTGMSLFSMGECITILVEKVDDNKTALTIESALKFGSIFAHHRHTKNFNRLIEALSEYLQSSGDNFVNKKTQGLKNVNKKGRAGNILYRDIHFPFSWIVLIFVFLGLATIAREGIINLIGLHTIPLFAISFFFFLGSGLLLAKGIQAKKANKIQPAKISFFIKAGFITLLLAAIFLLVTAFQVKDLSNKYEQAMVALKSEDWDKAIRLFSEIENESEDVIRKYKDTSKRLCEAKYEKAKDLLVSAMDNYSKNDFSASVDSTEKAIALLKGCQSLNTSATLLFQAKEFLKRPDNKKIIDKRIVDKQIAERDKICRGKQYLVYDITKNFVKNSLKSPSTAVFPRGWIEDVQVSYRGDCTYTIRSYVDSQNTFGASLRTYYYAEVRYDGDADSWFLEDISFN